MKMNLKFLSFISVLLMSFFSTIGIFESVRSEVVSHKKESCNTNNNGELSANKDLLIKLLTSLNAVDRADAAFRLGKMGKNASSAVPQLVTFLKDSNPYVRNSAIEALGEIVPALLFLS
jgi:HEAT repeat protein